MTEEFNREPVSGSASTGGIFEDFKAMPLDQKISNLFRMEVETLNEMIHAGADCAMDIFARAGDAISNFGTKLESEAKAAAEANKEDTSPNTAHTAGGITPEPPTYPTDVGYAPPGSSDKSFE